MPAYLELSRAGRLSEKIVAARALLQGCKVCPRQCGVDRLSGEVGKCHTGRLALVSSYGPHLGEESPLVGSHGSGTIFFTNCNLKCIYCQNFSISQLGEGMEVSKEELAKKMISLQDKGCHNINLVSPSHVVPQILEALEVAVDLGLRLPLVYNTGGYDSIETLKVLDGIVDIYMPDMKYSHAEVAVELSDIENYPDINRAAVREMHRQVGDLQINEDGVAVRGLLIRHLVLPQQLAGTEETVRFIAEKVSRNSYVNIMDQYHPCYKAREHKKLSRSLSTPELIEAMELAHQAGLTRLDRKHPAVLRIF